MRIKCWHKKVFSKKQFIQQWNNQTQAKLPPTKMELCDGEQCIIRQLRSISKRSILAYIPSYYSLLPMFGVLCSRMEASLLMMTAIACKELGESHPNRRPPTINFWLVSYLTLSKTKKIWPFWAGTQKKFKNQSPFF